MGLYGGPYDYVIHTALIATSSVVLLNFKHILVFYNLVNQNYIHATNFIFC